MEVRTDASNVLTIECLICGSRQVSELATASESRELLRNTGSEDDRAVTETELDATVGEIDSEHET